MDDEVDDQYWKTHKNDAPLCSLLYQYKSTCSGSCLTAAKAAARAFRVPSSWSSAEKYAIAFLFLFSGVLTYSILNIKYLQAKDVLIQEAKHDSELEKPVEVDPAFKKMLIGAVALMSLLSLILALLTLKAATWLFLFGTSAVLFGYALKLTMETGIKPCGGSEQYEYDSDDEDEETKASRSRENKYNAPSDPAATSSSNAGQKTATESDGVVA